MRKTTQKRSIIGPLTLYLSICAYARTTVEISACTFYVILTFYVLCIYVLCIFVQCLHIILNKINQLWCDVAATETAASGNKRHKYEPRFLHRCLNVACSKPILQAGLFVVTVIAISVTAVLIKQMHHEDTTTAPENPETATKNPETAPNHELKATNGETFPWSDIRLPSFIKPLTYDIHMHPDLKAFKFSGTVDIKFEVLKASDFIVFHVKSLKVTKLELREQGKQTVEEVVKWLKNKKHEQEYVQLSHRLMPHTHYTLSLTFQDELKNSMAGFYRSSYKTTAGQRR